MKITDVRQEYFRWEKSRPITNGMHTYTQCGRAVSTVETDQEMTGYGLSGPVLGINPFMMVDELKDRLIGQDPMRTEWLWDRLYVPKLTGRKGISTRTISGIDMALWDIKAKSLGLPLYRLLGEYRRSVPVYIAGGYYEPGKGIADLQREMEGYMEQGVAGVKMKVGALSIREDAARVKAVREAIGPRALLMLDANCAYSSHRAVQFAGLVEEYDIYCLEEPVAPHDYGGMKRLADKTVIPLAAGENEYTKWGFKELIDTGAVPILNPAPFLMGGVTEFLKTAALSQAHCLELAPHGDQTINVSLGAAVGNVSYIEYYPPAYDEVWQNAFNDSLEIDREGRLPAPERPGIGFEPDYSVLDRFRII